MEYPLCDRTVTRYRKTPEGIERTLLEGCYYEWLLGSRQDVAGVALKNTLKAAVLKDIAIGA